MAWSFRKRIKIAPGVHINLSKSGVSTSVGLRGAKMTMGPKGTYLHTGIPGTGIYNRQKIGPAPGARTSNPPSNVYLTPDSRTPNSNDQMNNGPKNRRGCITIILDAAIVVFLALFCAQFSPINKIKADIQRNEQLLEDLQSIREESTDGDVAESNNKDDYSKRFHYRSDNAVQSEIEILQNDLTWSYVKLALFGFLFLFAIVCLFLRSSAGERLLSSLSSGPSHTSPNPDTERAFNNIKSLIAETNNPLKIKILNQYLSGLIQEDAEKRLSPLVTKWTKKAAKNPSPEVEEKLRLIKEQYNTAISDAESRSFSVDEELTEEEKQAYKAFCDAFKAVCSCNKVWSVVSRTRNTEVKSSASTTVERDPISLKTDSFSALRSSFDIPTLPRRNGGFYYFYPRFIVCGRSIDDFDVVPLSSISLNYKPSRFIEDASYPKDAKKIDVTYQFVNKNGDPDRRYAYNPVLPIVLYGEITVLPYGEAFQTSNNDAAERFCSSYSDLKDGTILDRNDSTNEETTTDTSEEEVTDDRRNIFLPEPDELLSIAAAYVVSNHRARTSDLQRDLSIGYARAGRIMDQLEAIGVVGPQEGSSPRQVLISDVLELEAILSSIHSVPTLPGSISEQYYNDLVAAAKRLHGFGYRLAAKKDFCKIVDDTISGSISWDGKLLTEAKDKMHVYLWADIIHCYTGLGHDLDLSSNEGLGILVYNTIMLDPSFDFQYQFLDLLRTKLCVTSEKFTREAYASMEGPEDVFYLEYCLKKYDTQLHNQYVVFLYRFASLIAKADKNITQEESLWLNKIMALKISEGDKDVIEPIESNNDDFGKKKTQSSKTQKIAADELAGLIGLSSVKAEITSLTNYIKVQKMREEKGMKVTPVSLHCVFTGNPGTGKTTVARIVSEIYKELGLLKKGHLVETDRSGLVAEYVGQTAVKTNKIIDSALDGILFIDEAYSLVDGGSSDFGKEAIATLLKRMEDDRDRLVVILAGYTQDMKRFIDSNPGLQSRFNRYIEFPDYSADELFQIFCSCANKYEYTISVDAQELLKDTLVKAVANKDKNFGNGRYVRNLFEKVVENQANRLSTEVEVTAETLAIIKAEDILNSL